MSLASRRPLTHCRSPMLVLRPAHLCKMLSHAGGANGLPNAQGALLLCALGPSVTPTPTKLEHSPGACTG